MEEDFAWDKESTVIQQVDALAVYRNPAGNVVIRQRADYSRDEDEIIVVPIQYVPALIAALEKEITE